MKIKTRESAGIQPVYDIGLEKYHNYVLENGIIASNCFNKAHSVSYSMLTYISAYMKANYPVEFFCSLMTVRSKTLQPKTWAQKAPEYIQEAKALGVVINPPSVNGSTLDFTIKDNEVYFGLNAIRDVGKTAARSIVNTRGVKPFQDIYDFLARVNMRKVTIKTFQSLIKAGAFDKLGYVRSELMETSNDLYNYARDIVECEQRKIDSAARRIENEKVTTLIEKRNNLRKELKAEQRNLKKAQENNKQTITKLIENIEEKLEPFEEMKLRRLPQLKLKDEPVRIELERVEEVPISMNEIMEQAHYIGCYVNAHPAQLLLKTCDRLDSVWTGQRAQVCGVVNNIKIITTRKGQKMAFLEVDDSTAIADLTIFPNLWRRLESSGDLQTTSLIRINAKVESEEPGVKLIAENISVYKENQ